MPIMKKQTPFGSSPEPLAFRTRLDIIGVNPFVFVPTKHLQRIFLKAGKDKGPIPVEGTINGKPYRQTLVRYRSEWRLYVNTTMLSKSPQHVGETIAVTIHHDPKPRIIKPPMEFLRALKENKNAQAVFYHLPASRRNEIVRYLAHLKTEESRIRNIKRAIAFLLGKEGFVGRKKP